MPGHFYALLTYGSSGSRMFIYFERKGTQQGWRKMEEEVQEVEMTQDFDLDDDHPGIEPEFDEDAEHIPEEDFVVPEDYSVGSDPSEGFDAPLSEVDPMEFTLDNGQTLAISGASKNSIDDHAMIEYLHELFRISGGSKFSLPLKHEIIGFQHQYRLPSNGIVDKATWDKIQEEMVND